MKFPSQKWAKALIAWVIVVLVTTFIILAKAIERHVHFLLMEVEPESQLPFFLQTIKYWYAWAIVFLPLAFYLVYVHSRIENKMKKWLSLSVVLMLLLVLQALLLALLNYWPNYPWQKHGFWKVFLLLATIKLSVNFATSGFILICILLEDFYSNTRNQAIHAAKLSSQLSKAKLNALQMQLQPHFLFNTLHSISTLMYKNTGDADRMLARLSRLLRTVLETNDQNEWPLSMELGFLKEYLAIERIRFGSRLNCTFEVGPKVEENHLPPFLLQPLVENALKHGIGPRAEGGHLAIKASSIENHLYLEVSDDGVGISEESPRHHEGFGLTNTCQRLQSQYGSGHRFEITPKSGGGVLVRIWLPLTGQGEVG